MKKTWIRLSALLLLVALCLTALVACQNGTTPDAGENDPDTNDQTPDTNDQTPDTNDQTPDQGGEEDEKPELLDPAKAYILADNKKTEYVIIRDDTASDEVKAAITNFRNAFRAKTGADIQVMDDTTTPVAKEIIVAQMDQRSEPDQELLLLNGPGKTGYRVATAGEKIVVASPEVYLTDALDLLLRAISDCGNGMWGISQRYEGELDIPEITAKGELYDVGEGNYAYNVFKATAQFVNS